MNARLFFALPLLAAVAACASSPPPPPPPPPAPVVEAPAFPAGLDGVYRGFAVADQRACRPARIAVTSTVASGQAVFQWFRRAEVETKIKADGGVDFLFDGGHATGTFGPGTFAGKTTAQSGACTYTVTLKRS